MRSKYAALRHAGRLAGHVVVGFRLQLGEVDFGVELADVAAGQRLRLRGLAPVRRVGLVAGLGRARHRLLRVEAEADVEERGRRRVGAGAAGLRRAGDARRAAGRCPLASFHSPTPAARRTVEVPGFHSLCGTSTVICRRARSTLDARRRAGHGLRRCSRRSAPPFRRAPSGSTAPGALTFAPNGNGWRFAFVAADRDRRRDERRVFERVQRDPERRRSGVAA